MGKVDNAILDRNIKYLLAEFFDVSLEELLFKDMLREEQIKQKSRQIEQLKQELTRLEREQEEEK